MSKFCFIKPFGIKNICDKSEMILAIANELKMHNLGMQLYEQNYFWADGFDNIISVSDTPKTENCEMLLLPDKCTYNGKNNPIPFFERMNILKRAIEKLQNYTTGVEVFIGECASCPEEFTKMKCSLQEFPSLAYKAFYDERTCYQNELHFVICFQ